VKVVGINVEIIFTKFQGDGVCICCSGFPQGMVKMLENGYGAYLLENYQLFVRHM